MKKVIYTHLGNKYYYDNINDIYYQNAETLKHFLRIVKNYKYYSFLKSKINVFLEKNNLIHTSFFDYESMSIHLLEKHIERYTVIHEFTHCLQYICGLMEWDNLDNIFDISPKKYDIDNKYFEYAQMKNSNDREPYVAYCDILNSFGFGCYAKQLNSQSHTPAYYNDDTINYILESHSNYISLLENKRLDLINELPSEILFIIKKYDNLIQEKYNK